MLPGRPPRGSRVSSHDGHMQSPMFVLGGSGQPSDNPFPAPGRRPGRGKLVTDEGHEATDQGVSAGQCNGAVKIIIRTNAVGAEGDRLIHTCKGCLNGLDIGRRPPQGRPLGSGHLDDEAQLENVLDLMGLAKHTSGHPEHPRPKAPGNIDARPLPACHQAVRLKTGDGLAYHRAADGELLGQTRLGGKLLAGGELTATNALLQHLGHLLGKAMGT